MGDDGGRRSVTQPKLVRIYDKLYTLGLHRHVDVPAVVVLGEQSAGKSSVLQRLCGIPFPRGDDVCTRFMTRIVMRTAIGGTFKRKASIIPADDANDKDKEAFDRFGRQDVTDSDFSLVFKNAQELIDGERGSQGLRKHILQIEIEKAGNECFTVIDVPGWVEAEGDGITQHDINDIQTIIKSWIRRPRTLLLAVASLGREWGSFKVLNLISKDPDASRRALGVFTNPDAATPRRRELASDTLRGQFETYNWAMGWHVVRNPGRDEQHMSGDDADKQELEELSKDKWASIDSKHKGIPTLVTKLAACIYCLFIETGPDLRVEIAARLREREEELNDVKADQSSSAMKKMVEGWNDSFKKALNAAIPQMGYVGGTRFSSGCSDTPMSLFVLAQAHLDRLEQRLSSSEGVSYQIRTKEGGPFSPLLAKKVREISDGWHIEETGDTNYKDAVWQLFLVQTEPWNKLVQEFVNGLTEDLRASLEHVAESISNVTPQVCNTWKDICVRRACKTFYQSLFTHYDTQLGNLKPQRTVFHAAVSIAKPKARREEWGRILTDCLLKASPLKPHEREHRRLPKNVEIDMQDLYQQLLMLQEEPSLTQAEIVGGMEGIYKVSRPPARTCCQADLVISGEAEEPHERSRHCPGTQRPRRSS